MNFAKLAKKLNVHYFGMLTSDGASPKSYIFVLKNKGQAEEAVLQLGIPSVHFYRPAMITKRDNDFRWSEQVYKIIPFAPKITGHDLGQVILHHFVNNAKS